MFDGLASLHQLHRKKLQHLPGKKERRIEGRVVSTTVGAKERHGEGEEEQNTGPKGIGRHAPVDKKVKEARKDEEDR